MDHAVYAASGPQPPPRCEFPIFLEKDRYFLPERDMSGGLSKIRGIDNPAIRSLIEKAQPWQHVERPRYHLLWMVHELDVQDKHRLLTPVAMFPKDLRGKVRVTSPGQGDESVQVTGPAVVTLDDHALVMTVRTPRPATRAEVNASVTLGIGVRVGETDMGVTAVLGESIRVIRTLIEQIKGVVT